MVRRAPAASPSPTLFATSDCPAVPSESARNASRSHDWNATWCAAMEAAPPSLPEYAAACVALRRRRAPTASAPLVGSETSGAEMRSGGCGGGGSGGGGAHHGGRGVEQDALQQHAAGEDRPAGLHKRPQVLPAESRRAVHG